jgi:N6-adenosine-specific RNA methylase IME4
VSRYRTLVVDPPWRYTKERRPRAAYGRGAAENHYETMGFTQITALDIGSLAEDDAHLYLWVTNPLLTEQRTDGHTAAAIARAWGFEPKTIITWLKDQPGLGFFFRGWTEHVMFCVRGNAPIPPELREPNYFRAPRTEHSVKPDCFYDMVERVSPRPYAELFARQARFDWNYPIGDQALGGIAA